MAEKGKFIQPPPRLRQKVRRSGGPTAKQAIMSALNAAEDLMEHYQGWAVDDLTKLWQAFQSTPSAKVAPERVTEMFEISHGIRGEGGTFGYPLISAIADSLCKFLEGKNHVSRKGLEVVKVHILAMRAVFRQDYKGAHPTLERELRQLLALLRDRMG